MSRFDCRIVNPTLEKASRAELLAFQERRLVAQIRRAYERIPYYNRIWPKAAATISSYEDFRQIIPFQDKLSLLDRQDEFMTDRVAEPGSPVFWLHMTSGTTGLGQEVHPLTRLDVEASGLGWVYQARWAGLEPGDRIFYTFPVGMQTGGLSSFPMSDKMATLSFQTGPYSTEKKIDHLLRFKPHAFNISPAYLNRFQAILEERGLDPRVELPDLKAIFIAGESYTLDWALRAQEFWNAPISEWYGCMQGGMNLSFSCEHGITPGGQRGHLHSLEHRVLCEILHPGTNDPVQPGEQGEMVITTLYREAFPVVRFRTGDRVRLMPEPCPCGRPFASIEAGTVARYDDMMKFRGQNFWPDAVDKIVFAKGDVEEYAGRIYIDEGGREQGDINLEFKPGAGLSEADKATRIGALSKQIQADLNVRMEMREVPYLSVPRFEFKTRRWTDQRREGRQFVRYTRD